MNRKEEARIAAQLAKAMAMICVRNSMLENLHAGRVPVTRTGDFSDVFVVDAEGNRIPWAEVSRLDDDEMRDLMRQVVNRLYTFQMRFGDPDFQRTVDRWLRIAAKWDEPELDRGLAGLGTEYPPRFETPD
ncbi:hypothetical protein D3P06_00970 [Paracoccus aestuarii]|uniref:Uncharacterized protein n=1 Tax=Paracoccus aestuarii TaxID=453842 RepID=A0A419A2G9_9RHOB|nr:hypothetical protein [Paracoccus aestuarii]RJL07340.1 hypothetical protein D3P06_00970 [Paracoccus aestuarii]WCR00037.1 hypothetical protein JHW48_04825 [Paracoccus aestuarii]